MSSCLDKDSANFDEKFVQFYPYNCLRKMTGKNLKNQAILKITPINSIIFCFD